MARHKISTIIFCLFLTQAVLCKPINDSSEESSEKSSEETSQEIQAALEELKVNGTDSEKLILSRMGNYVLIPQRFVSKAANASKYLLKDETLHANNNAQVLELKKNLTIFLEKYDAAANLQATHEAMDIFFNTTAHYFNLDNETITPESKFIIELLNKYNVEDFAVKLQDVEAAIDKWRITGTTEEKIFLFTMDGLVTIPQQYAANATDAIQHLFKDETLKTNLQPEIEKFKKKLNTYLEKYDPTTSDIKSVHASMRYFYNITASYYELPVEKVTEESKFIVDLLNKYDCKKYSIELVKYFNSFFAEFVKIFEEFKGDFKQPVLDWFDKFIKITDINEQMILLKEFMTLIHE